MKNFDSDFALVRAARRRDHDAWTQLYERLAEQVFGFLSNQSISREEAEDLTATTFLEAMRSADRFKGNYADMRAWIFRIARNNLIDTTRKLARPLSPPSPPPLSDSETEAMASLQVWEVRRAIALLPPDQRDVLLLRVNGDLSDREIAAILRRSTGAVKALAHRGLKGLARQLNVGETSFDP